MVKTASCNTATGRWWNMVLQLTIIKQRLATRSCNQTTSCNKVGVGPSFLTDEVGSREAYRAPIEPSVFLTPHSSQHCLASAPHTTTPQLIHKRIYRNAYTSAFLYIFISICIYVYAYTYKCVCVCIYACIVHTYMYKYERTLENKTTFCCVYLRSAEAEGEG